MKATIILEDTPQGISAELHWHDNDITDNLYQSLSMMLAAQFTGHLKQLAKCGSIHLEKE